MDDRIEFEIMPLSVILKNHTTTSLDKYQKLSLKSFLIRTSPFVSDTLRLVGDNTYGVEDGHGNGDWNGMVGELVRGVSD